VRTQLPLLGFAFLVLFYWFRHKCGLILRKESRPDRAQQVAVANQLRFISIAETAETLPAAELDAADRLLAADYVVVVCLLRYTAPARGRKFTFSQRLLMIDFRLLTHWYALTRRRLQGQARHTISERARVLVCLASAMGERTAVLPGV